MQVAQVAHRLAEGLLNRLPGLPAFTGISTITGTAEHLYWDETTQAWTPADQLRPGDLLQTTNGHTVVILALRDHTSTMATHNLTVDNLHTYYVEAGSTPVLVHNCDAIALGKSSTDSNPYALADFSDRTGAPGFTDWDPGKNWAQVVRDALNPKSNTTIFFNLEGIDDPSAYADTANLSDPDDSEYTAWELAMIRNSPKSVQSRVVWYNGRTPAANPFASQ